MSTHRKAGLWSGLDRPILVIVIFLMAVGVVLSFAASSSAAERASWIDDPFYYLYRQLTFTGLGLLPLPEVTAIGFATPIFTVILAAVLLGEQIRLVRVTAVAMGLVGS